MSTILNIGVIKSLAMSIVSENDKLNDEYDAIKKAGEPSVTQTHAYQKGVDVLDHASYHLVAAIAATDVGDEVHNILECHRVLLLNLGTDVE